MEKVFILNPDLAISELKDAIIERITKAKSITSCLLDSSGYDIDRSLFHGIFLALDGYLIEIDCLFDKLSR